MSVYLRFNVPTQVSITGYRSDVATLLSGGGDVHFRIYSGHLYQIGLYRLDGTLLGYLRVDVPGAVPIGMVRPGGGGGGGAPLRIPGASSVTVSGGSAQTNGVDAVRTRLAASSTNVSSALGSANNRILVDGGDTISSGSRSVSAATAGGVEAIPPTLIPEVMWISTFHDV